MYGCILCKPPNEYKSLWCDVTFLTGDLEIVAELWLLLGFLFLPLPETNLPFQQERQKQVINLLENLYQQSSLSLLGVSQSEAGIVAEISLLPYLLVAPAWSKDVLCPSTSPGCCFCAQPGTFTLKGLSLSTGLEFLSPGRTWNTWEHPLRSGVA